MTDDIVTRLRAYLPTLAEYELVRMAKEAVDEIERLRKLVDLYRQQCNWMNKELLDVEMRDASPSE